MRLILKESLTIISSKTLSEVVEKLGAKIMAPDSFREGFSGNSPPYVGQISPRGFKIRRFRFNSSGWIPDRALCLPDIQGKFESDGNQVIVLMTIRLAVGVIAFVVFCFLVCYSLTVVMFWSAVSFGWGFPLIQSLGFLGFPVWVSFVILQVFREQTARIQQELTQIILEDT